VYRRELLGALGVGGVAVGSGCSGLLDTGRPSYLDTITVRNEDGVAHEFSLTVERGDTVVHETTVELARSEFRDGDQHTPLSSVDCEWSGRGPYVVLCELGSGRSEAVRVDKEIQQGAGEHAHVTFVATDSEAVDWSGYLDDGGGNRCTRSPTE